MADLQPPAGNKQPRILKRNTMADGVARQAVVKGTTSYSFEDLHEEIAKDAIQKLNFSYLSKAQCQHMRSMCKKSCPDEITKYVVKPAVFVK
jgi:hypothetical protein